MYGLMCRKGWASDIFFGLSDHQYAKQKRMFQRLRRLSTGRVETGDNAFISKNNLG